MNHRVISILPKLQQSPIRVLVIPGLHNSEETHWQSWLERQYRGAKRVKQTDWDTPDLDAWASQIEATIHRQSRDTQWIAVAHSFGCLALARYIDQQRAGNRPHQIASGLLVAPADPVKFGVVHKLPQEGLGIPTTLIGSETDPWMPVERAEQWATLWGSRFMNLGDAGHINVASGHGVWPFARFKVDQMIREQQRQKRIERAHPLEFHFAV